MLAVQLLIYYALVLFLKNSWPFCASVKTTLKHLSVFFLVFFKNIVLVKLFIFLLSYVNLFIVAASNPSLVRPKN